MNFTAPPRPLSYESISSTLTLAINLCIRSGQPRRAERYYQKLAKMMPTASDDEEILALMNIATQIKACQLTDEQISEAHAIFYQVVREFNTQVIRSVTWVDEWSDPDPDKPFKDLVTELIIPMDAPLLKMNERVFQLKQEAKPDTETSWRYSLMFMRGEANT